MTKPTIGRVVHYWASFPGGGGQPRAAIIYYVRYKQPEDNMVSLWTWSALGIQEGFVFVEYSPRPECGKWTWPDQHDNTGITLC